MEEEAKAAPKFSLVEVMMGITVTLLIDGLSVFADSVGIDLGWAVQIPTWLVFTFWFTMKGVKQTASLGKRFVAPILIELLPDWLIPFQLTLIFLITVLFENHPEFLQKLAGGFSKLTGGAAKIAGKFTGGTGKLAGGAAKIAAVAGKASETGASLADASAKARPSLQRTQPLAGAAGSGSSELPSENAEPA